MFAQVIPALMIAAFLSGIRINHRDRTTTVFASVCIVLATGAELVVLVAVFAGGTIPTPLGFAVTVAAGLLAFSVAATAILKLSRDEHGEGDGQGDGDR
ncbi:MAG: hypothetical protein JWR04_2833 [Rhodoglobus sp.]|nr:hypothetical protein [Rhodoglobus sp.]